MSDNDDAANKAVALLNELIEEQRVRNQILERRNELLEDQNALLYAAIEAYYWVSHEPDEALIEQAKRSGTPNPAVRDGLFELNYTDLHGGRSGGCPEDDRR